LGKNNQHPVQQNLSEISKQEKESSLLTHAIIDSKEKKEKKRPRVLFNIPLKNEEEAPSQKPKKIMVSEKKNQIISTKPLKDKKVPIKVKTDFLQEVAPQPFSGSIYNKKYSLNKNKPIHVNSNEPDPKTASIPQATPISPKIISNGTLENDSTSLKWKQLEKDMINVLGFLSKKLKVPKEEKSKPKPIEVKNRIPPTSMNEILMQLMTIDVNIEASAIIKTDGTILASAISNRITDVLFATIGKNLFFISHDIINGLNAGNLKSISVKGTEGVLDLAPIDKNSPLVKDMLLIIFSSPKVKGGVINIASSLIKKQIKEYLGVEK